MENHKIEAADILLAVVMALLITSALSLTGCNLAYKPDVSIENAEIQHQSGNTTELKGEYNAK